MCRDIGEWYARKDREAQEAWAELQAARERHRLAIEAGESPLLIQNLREDVRRAHERHERAAYVGD